MPRRLNGREISACALERSHSSPFRAEIPRSGHLVSALAMDGSAAPTGNSGRRPWVPRAR
ncbi:MAG TPA: hypothetical protein VFQ61_12260, partial [Polyangiaceae bacterium]|nr:hypothetical protein [Polyangiaceae bacterium]